MEKQRLKLQNSVPVEKRERNRNYRRVEKEYLKRKQKHDDARLNATKARNEYLLCMDAANASIQKYFVDDLSDLIDCMDFGFHQVRSLIIFFRFEISRQNSIPRAIFKNSRQMTAVRNE